MFNIINHENNQSIDLKKPILHIFYAHNYLLFVTMKREDKDLTSIDRHPETSSTKTPEPETVNTNIISTTISNQYSFSIFHRGSRGGIPRKQIPQHDGAEEGLRRAGHPVQLQEDGHHQGCLRLQIVGHRTPVLPDHHDEDWTHQTGWIHRFPQEVSSCFTL